MGCTLIDGIVGTCSYDASGVEKLWLANKAAFTGATTYNASLQVTGVSYNDALYEIVPALDSCTFSDDLVVNGSRRNFLQTIVFGIGALDATVLATLETMGLSNLVAFVKDASGNFRAFGLEGTGLRTTVMTDTSGTSAGNDGAVSVTLAGSSLTKGRFIEAAYAATLGLT